LNKKILIIGNGFDLRHFLPTQYNHFICILKEIENASIITDLTFENLFNNEFKLYDPSFYKKIKQFYNTEKLKFKKEELNNIKDKLNKNLWYKYFKTIDDSHIESWIDFETEINRVLESIVKLFNKLDERIKNSKNPFSGEYYFDYSYNDLDYFESSLSKILLTNLEIFIPHDRISVMLNDKYCFKVNGNIELIHKNKVLNNLYDSLQEFTAIFNDFFVSIVTKFYSYFQDDKKENFLEYYKSSLLGSIDKVYSFNYTKTVEKFYLHKEVEFLHGQIIENWSELSDLKIVLGVDDLEENLKKHKLFNFTKYFQKLHKQTDYQFLHHIDSTSPHTFYFWGHSLDISDKEYINEVFDQLNEEISKIHINYISLSKIIILHHSISSKADLLNNLLSIIGKEEIEKLMKQKRLTFIQATEENLFKVLNN
jgi:hypothetical protein